MSYGLGSNLVCDDWLDWSLSCFCWMGMAASPSAHWLEFLEPRTQPSSGFDLEPRRPLWWRSCCGERQRCGCSLGRPGGDVGCSAEAPPGKLCWTELRGLFWGALLVTDSVLIRVSGWRGLKSWNLVDSCFSLLGFWASPVAQLVQNPPEMWETWVWSLGWEDPLEKVSTTHSFWKQEFSLWIMITSIFVQSLSTVWLFETPWTAARHTSVLRHLPELAQTHVHWIGDAMQPSQPLSSPSPPAFNRSQPVSWLFESGCQSIGASASVTSIYCGYNFQV